MLFGVLKHEFCQIQGVSLDSIKVCTFRVAIPSTVRSEGFFLFCYPMKYVLLGLLKNFQKMSDSKRLYIYKFILLVITSVYNTKLFSYMLTLHCLLTRSLCFELVYKNCTRPLFIVSELYYKNIQLINSFKLYYRNFGAKPSFMG